MTTPIRTINPARALATVIVAATVFVAAAPVLSPVRIVAADAPPPVPESPTALTPESAGWLQAVNEYRADSGLAPVAEEPTWTAGGVDHLTYLRNTDASLRTGRYANAHLENPESPWYSADGDAAARSSDIGGGPTDRAAIDGWMAAPFHAVAILRAQLTRSAFARSDGVAMLDVLRGLDPAAPSRIAPIVFPGNGATSRLSSLVDERPDPREGCGADPAAFTGLPLFAMLPQPPLAGVTATLRGENGVSIGQGADLCVQTSATFNSSDPVYGAIGKTVLQAANVVLVIPREPLVSGSYTTTIEQPGLPDVVWSFTVVSPPTSPQSVSSIWAGPGRTRISWSPPAAGGDDVESYTVRFHGGPSSTVPSDQRSLILELPADAESAVIEVVATNRDGSTFESRVETMIPTLPGRSTGGRSVLRDSRVAVATNAPPGAQAVLANIAMVGAALPGYVTADRCGALGGGQQSRSSGNHGVGDAVANIAVVGIDEDGSFCVYSQVPTDLAVDVQGSFAEAGSTLGAGLRFTSSSPSRKLDTRAGPTPEAGSIVRVDTGVPSGTEAVLVNLTMTDAAAPGYITADRCSALGSGDQTKSSGNHGVGAPVADLAVVPVDPDGSFCIYTQAAADLVVDLQGSFSTAGDLAFSLAGPTRILDTRGTGVPPTAGRVVEVATSAPAGTRAVLVNIAMVDGSTPGYITADTCADLSADGSQTKSSGNHTQGAIVSNVAVVPVDDDGRFCIYSQAPVGLVVDLQGTFSSDGPLLFSPAPPTRVLDTRG